MHVLERWEGCITMNNREEQFQLDNKELIVNLEMALSDALALLDDNLIVPLQKRSQLTELLNSYVEKLNVPEKVALSAIRRSSEKKDLKFVEEVVLNELKTCANPLELLAKVAREKIVSEVVCLDNSDGRYLIDNNFLEEVTDAETKEKYYILTSKAIQSLKNRNVRAGYKDKFLAGAVPDNTVRTLDKWSQIYGYRLKMLHKYFDELGKEFFAFNLGANEDLLFGCEVSDVVGVNYVFPAIWGNEADKDIDEIKNLLHSGLIDSMLILVKSEKEKIDLINKELASNEDSKIEYFIME